MMSNEISPGGGFQQTRPTYTQIEKEREIEKKREQLMKEFEELDLNKNNYLERAEIKDALDEKMR